MIFLLLLASLIAFLGGIHVFYILVLKRVWGNSQKAEQFKRTTMNKVTFPFVSIIIPVHNEESVIERRLNNILECTYPSDKSEIIVIDSGSKDETAKIVDIKFSNRVKLIVENERKGKAHAINLALGSCHGEIVILTDGPTLYEKTTISEIVAPFQDPSIGGVTVLCKIPNSSENQITKTDSILWSYKDRIRIMESKIYSTTWLSGEACAFRRNLIDHIPEDTLADDSNIAMQLISKGQRVIVNENSFYAEKSPSTLDDYLKVKVRRALGGMRETLRFRYFLFNRKFGSFGLIIFPYRFFTDIVSPIISILIAALVIPAFIDVYNELGPGITILIAVITFGCAFVVRGKFMPFIYVQLIMSLALISLLNGKIDVNWFQSKTIRYT